MRLFRVVVAGGTIGVLSEKEVVLLDASLAPKRTLPLAATTRPIDVALSPDGEHVASCFESGVSLEGRAFSGDDRWANDSAITWARDAIWALREPGGEVFVLDPKTLAVRAKGSLHWGDEARISFVAHAEGHVYAVGTEGENGAETHALIVSGDVVRDVPLPELEGSYWLACTPSGAHVASQTADGTVTLRDATTLATLHTTSAPPSFSIVGFLDETRAVFSNGAELRIVDLTPPKESKPGSVAAALRARVPSDPPSQAAEDRGTRLLARLLEAGEIELVRKADRRELAEHLDDLFASRRMTAETVAGVLEEHDSVAELFADDDRIAAILHDMG
jgi:hypothetical protein